MKRVSYILPVLCLFGMVTGMLWPAHCARIKSGDAWQIRENLVYRLGSEKYRIGLLRQELGQFNDVLAAISDVRQISGELTKLEGEKRLQFDKHSASLEKRRMALEAQINALESPLMDAVSILREMVVGEPVPSMFEVLQQGNVSRVNQLLLLRYQIDTLWKATDTLLAAFMHDAGQIPVKKSTKDAPDDEFMAIGNANRTAIAHAANRTIEDILDALAKRADGVRIKEMFAVEMGRIKNCIENGKLVQAQRKIKEMRDRYADRLPAAELHLIAARVSFLEGNYAKTLEYLSMVKAAPLGSTLAVLYRLQSLFALNYHDSLWVEGNKSDLKKLTSAQRNLVVWMTMESGLALRKEKESFVSLSANIDTNAPYALHAMYALGRAYTANNDLTTALSIFQSSVRRTVHSAMDKIALREIKMAIAETLYDLGKFDDALPVFYEFLNEQKDFERSLYGIIWCYLSLGMNEKAETALKKLINQSPESRYAAEGLLLLAKRYLYKADYEWKKTVYLVQEERRLSGIAERLELQRKNGDSQQRPIDYAATSRELSTLMTRIVSEPRHDYAALASWYEKADTIGALIARHYVTGSFQEQAFTRQREKLLKVIDSINGVLPAPRLDSPALLYISTKALESNPVKATVRKAACFTAEVALNRYRWELDFIAHQKSQLNLAAARIDQSLKTETAATVQRELGNQKKQCVRSIDSLVAREDSLKATWYPRLVGKLQKILSENPCPQEAGYFHYHYGELLYREENARYLRDYDVYELERARYEEELAMFRENTMLVLPSEPERVRIVHDSSMKEFRKAAALSVSPEVKAAAQYSLAWCFNDVGMVDSAMAHMMIVADSYPQSQFAPQAWMYVGECFFDRGELREAVTCYQSVMKFPESEWFDEALYKLAWSQYRLSNPEKAISSFLALVDLGGGSFGGALLEKESMDYIAISFSETDLTGEKGLERATAFVQKIGNANRGSQILEKLARVFQDQGRYALAQKSYTTLLKLNPGFYNTPLIENELIQVKKRDATPDELNLMRFDFFTKYHATGAWAKTQTNSRIVAIADSLAQQSLYSAAQGFHQSALQQNDSAIYARALRAYTEFIRTYPQALATSECHYNLAEIEFAIGNYYRAAQEYIAVSKRYKDSRFRETAAWNAIVACQNLLKNEALKQ